MKYILCSLILLSTLHLRSQELFVNAEPASNMPARSLSFKLTGHFVSEDKIYGRFGQRYMPQLMFGLNKRLMVHLGATFADMHTSNFRYESYNVYAKYRFLSNDDLHKHFRMAVYVNGSQTDAPFHYDEIDLMGSKSGIEAGLIATQLWNKFALSATVSNIQVLDASRNDEVIYVPERAYQSLNYSLSSGYLLIPREYVDYRQTNLNLYLEILGQQTLDVSHYYLDLAPSLQIIFNSNTKVNLGFRFELAGDMERMSKNSWQISIERTFLNAFPKRSQR